MVSSQSSPSFSCLATFSLWSLTGAHAPDDSYNLSEGDFGYCFLLVEDLYNLLDIGMGFVIIMHATTKFLSLMCQPSINVVVGPGGIASSMAREDGCLPTML